ncbi:hypothetical protein KGF54_002558 [Candida jiufengensis]|uniref:uncharacterized protein n=1 Tax=Candida jiufengensis TaxID=497108 RepID=UPI0022254668|nr:uncharacterized protein KGF54_002558 [Candida jiufengensis]KAI5953187.1 hypothetical protein KGF54_002558 [Candida jiufengensis]
MDCTTLNIELDPESKKKIINKQYLIVKKIGQGQFGKVFLGKCINQKNQSKSSLSTNPSFVAIKTINRIDKSKLITKSYINNHSKIAKEIEILKQCNHPNVVKLLSVIDDLHFDKIFLILEHCKYQEIEYKTYNHYYEKYNVSKQRNSLPLNKILRDVINGLEYLHDYKNIIHRDIKPSNLLIDENNNVKISDFGVSLILENNLDNDSKELLKTTGTPAFYAPELCQFISKQSESAKVYEISKKIDIWSLGITLYSLIFNTVPFSGINEYQTINKILSEEVKFPTTLKTKRATSDDILEFNHLKDLIKKLLIKDPGHRVSIKEIKNHKFTLFDLSKNESEKFLNFNKNQFQSGISSKLRKLFTKTTATNVSPKKTQVSHNPNPSDLKNVDDLLDSYLDDSSSLSSMEDAEPINTNNILEEIHLSSTSSPASSPNKYIPPHLNLKSNNCTNKKPELYTYQNKSLKDLDLSFLPPQPNDTNKSVITPSNSVHSSLSTPVNDSFATIGQPSPNNYQQFFSPSKRFFDQSVHHRHQNIEQYTKTPSIRSLTNEESSLKGPPISQYHQFERPSSIGSNNGLSRIPSSSSSLNLHAYFNDNESIISNHSITKYNIKPKFNFIDDNQSNSKSDSRKDNEEFDEDESEVNNTTINLSDNFNLGIKYKDLSTYLDGL